MKTIGPRFCLLFLAWLGVLAAVFELWRRHWVDLYMYPISSSAAFLLNAVGIGAELSAPILPEGVCQLALDNVVYRVSFECTGLFAFFICLACVLAYPTTVGTKIKGVFLVAPAFYVYSTLRLVILGLVAHFLPAHIELFHIYVMVLVNIGYVLALWLYWIQQAVPYPAGRPG